MEVFTERLYFKSSFLHYPMGKPIANFTCLLVNSVRFGESINGTDEMVNIHDSFPNRIHKTEKNKM